MRKTESVVAKQEAALRSLAMPVSKPTEKKRRSAHRTQWAAQFAVVSELCKRGYEVAFTMGNHPQADLMVIRPNRVPFVVDVKRTLQKELLAGPSAAGP